MAQIRGYIPAGGKGSRMKPFRLCKEMLPIIIPNTESDEVVLLIENALNTLIEGGAEDFLITVNHNKESLVRCVNDFCISNKMKSAFIYQDLDNKEYGLPYVIADAAKFLRGNTVFMKFPDTVVSPKDCFKKLYEFHKEKKADITLGVFPTKDPERLGPVCIGTNGKVVLIQDKPSNPLEYNTWNVIIWEDKFLDILVQLVDQVRSESTTKKELLIIDVFNKALENGLNIYAKLFENGACKDISCISDVKSMWINNESKQERKEDIYA